MADRKKSRFSVGYSQNHLAVAGGCEAFGSDRVYDVPTRYRVVVLTVPKFGSDEH